MNKKCPPLSHWKKWNHFCTIWLEERLYSEKYDKFQSLENYLSKNMIFSISIQKKKWSKAKLEPLFDNQKEAYLAYSEGKVSTCPIQTLGQLPLGKLLGGKNAQTCVKTGYVEGDTVYVIKVAAGGAVGYGNYGLMLAFSQSNLTLETMVNFICRRFRVRFSTLSFKMFYDFIK